MANVNVQAIRAINREWDDPAVRLAFEAERGFPPLEPLYSDAWELQRMAGIVEEYERQFWVWSRARFDAARASAA